MNGPSGTLQADLPSAAIPVEREGDQRRGIIAKRGSENIVYVDESGFEPEVCRATAGARAAKKFMAITAASAAHEPA